MTLYRSGPRTAPPRSANGPPFAAKQRPRSERLSSETRQRLWRIAHLSAFVLVPVVLLSLAAAAILYVRLLHGPISLKAFSERIEASINAELFGFAATIDDAVITLANDYKVELRLINLRIKEADGDLVASAPLAAVELNKSELWRLNAAPERVYLIEPRLAVVYSEEQGFSFSIAEAPVTSEDAAAAGQAETPIKPPAPVPARRPDAGAAGTSALPSFHRIDLARILAEGSARARSGDAATANLRKFGVRNALVSVSYRGAMSDVNVVEASVDLEHMKRRSVMSGTATIASSKGPWSIAFRSEESDRRDTLKVTTTVQDLVPSTLSELSPGLGLLDLFDAPLTGQLTLDLSTAGDLKAADLGLEVGRGFVRLPSLSNTPLLLDGGRVQLVYDADKRRLSLAPSTFDWGESRITLEGTMSSDPEAGGAQWSFDLRSIDGMLGAEEFGVAAFPIESFKASGRIIPNEGFLQLSELSLRAGGGEVTANGEILTGSDIPSTRVEAAVSPMPLAVLKAMWPRAAAPTARAWVGTQVETANLKSASLKLLSGKFLDAATGAAAGARRERLSASMEIADLRMHPLPRSLPIEAPSALIRLENSSLEVTVPTAQIIASAEHRLPLNGVRLTVVDVTHDAPIAELAVKSQASLQALIETLNHSELNLAGQGPLPIEGISGKVDGELKISMPLVTGATVIKADGKARVTELKGKSKEHGLDLQGGTIDINVSDIGVIAKGDMIVNGVIAKLHMHRILDAPPEMQPPLRISATLDNSDRTQLGLDVNHLVQGDVQVEVTVAHKTDQAPAIHLRADLTNSELLFTDIAWRKGPGRTASIEFDVDTSDPALMRLQNFRLVGDNIAVDGWLTIDDRREVQEFHFPNFSLNVVSRLDVQGKVNDKRIWKISAKGPTFDAKDMFRSLLALGNTVETEIKPLRPAAGADFTAEIDTVLGHADVSLRGYKGTVSERNDKIVSLQGTGTLDGGGPLSVTLSASGPRKLYADSTDAGQAFKLMGFYPNIIGGKLKLEVNLEASGAADKSGLLWVENFKVLGDPIISEVYSSAEGGSGSEDRKKRVSREVFEFERMKVPFSIGHGQFVLDDSYVRGPLVGASIRGTVDYNSRRVNLGGTYVPLQGINAAICDVPLFGPIVAGFDCQGVFGITYSIEGPMDEPQAFVNPLSMFTPGILRGMMEMTSPNPQVRPKREKETAPVEDRVRSSSSSAKSQKDSSAVDGWSSQTTTGDGKKDKGTQKK